MTVQEGRAWTRIAFADQLESAVINSTGFREHFGTLASHPYNRDKPDQTVWWLFQRSSTPWGLWPAYSIGKYFFDRQSARRVMRAGLHIEKGIAPEHAQVYGTTRGGFFGMTPDWAWFGFVEDLRSGLVAAAVEEVEKRSREHVEITVEPNFPLDQPELHENVGHHRFVVTEGAGLRLVEEHPRSDRLPGIGKVASIRELGDRFARATEEEKWTWINVFVSVALPFQANPPAGAGPEWNGSDFWNRVLEPLAGWVK